MVNSYIYVYISHIPFQIIARIYSCEGHCFSLTHTLNHLHVINTFRQVRRRICTNKHIHTLSLSHAHTLSHTHTRTHAQAHIHILVLSLPISIACDRRYRVAKTHRIP